MGPYNIKHFYEFPYIKVNFRQYLFNEITECISILPYKTQCSHINQYRYCLEKQYRFGSCPLRWPGTKQRARQSPESNSKNVIEDPLLSYGLFLKFPLRFVAPDFMVQALFMLK